jgi:thiol:disulfide interchange protein
MAEKKPLTIKQQYRRNKAYQYGLVGGEYVSTLLPYGIMAIVNREEWFVYNPDSWKVGLGGAIGMVLLALAMFLITKRKDNEKLADGMIALVIGWYAVTFVFFLLAQINMEIYKIMAYGGLGLMGALGLDIGSKHFEKKAKDLKQAMTNAKTNLDTEQATKEILEQEKKKKKVAVD